MDTSTSRKYKAQRQDFFWRKLLAKICDFKVLCDRPMLEQTRIHQRLNMTTVNAIQWINRSMQYQNASPWLHWTPHESKHFSTKWFSHLTVSLRPSFVARSCIKSIGRLWKNVEEKCHWQFSCASNEGNLDIRESNCVVQPPVQSKKTENILKPLSGSK